MDLCDLDVLDLCAGTGNIGLEFVSRGAQKVMSIDQHPVCFKHINTLVSQLQIGHKMSVHRIDMFKFIKHSDQIFDIVFADPPYDYKHYKDLIDLVLERKIIRKGGWLIIEHGKQTVLGDVSGFTFAKAFGNVYFSFFKLSED
jgi:16S rRNA (guanine966-N2)-methyltransferase